jgi:hypothetical protein
LLLKFNGCDVIKVKVGIGLLEKKKPCHFSFLLPAPQTVKRSRAWPSHSGEAIAQARSRDILDDQ